MSDDSNGPRTTNFLTAVDKALVNYLSDLRVNGVEVQAFVNRFPVYDQDKKEVGMERLNEVYLTEAGVPRGRLIHLQSFYGEGLVQETIVYVGPEHNIEDAETVAKDANKYTHRIDMMTMEEKPGDVSLRYSQIEALYLDISDPDISAPLNDEAIELIIDTAYDENELQIDIEPMQTSKEQHTEDAANAYLEGNIIEAKRIGDEGIERYLTLADAKDAGMNHHLLRLSMVAALTATMRHLADIEYDRFVTLTPDFALDLGSRELLQPYLHMHDRPLTETDRKNLVRGLQKALEPRGIDRKELIGLAKKILKEGSKNLRMQRYCDDMAHRLTLYRLKQPTLAGLRKYVLPRLGTAAIHTPAQETAKDLAEVLFQGRDTSEIERRFNDAENSFQLDGLKLFIVGEDSRVAFKSRVYAHSLETEEELTDLVLELMKGAEEAAQEPIHSPEAANDDKEVPAPDKVIDLDKWRKKAVNGDDK